jgi:hypothetical protein
MSNLLYLGLAVGLSAIGGLLIYVRNRKPRSLTSGIDEFRSGLQALAPNEERRARETVAPHVRKTTEQPSPRRPRRR